MAFSGTIVNVPVMQQNHLVANEDSSLHYWHHIFYTSNERKTFWKHTSNWYTIQQFL